MLYLDIDPKTFPEVVYVHTFIKNNFSNISNESSPSVEVIYVKSGKLKLVIQNNTYMVKNGDFLILPHNYEIKLESVGEDIHIHYAACIKLGDKITLYDKVPENGKIILPIVLPQCNQSEDLFNKLNNLIDVYNENSTYDSYICACKVFEFICDVGKVAQNFYNFGKEFSTPYAKIYSERIKKYIFNNLYRPINLSEIANFMKKSPNYLNYIFKCENGISINQYINIEKIKVVAKLITEHDKSLSHCCNVIGINDPNYLSRLFKKVMGVSASKFKMNNVKTTFQTKGE